MDGQASPIAVIELIAAAIIVFVAGILLTSILSSIGGSAVDLGMIAGVVVVVGGALAMGLLAVGDRHE